MRVESRNRRVPRAPPVARYPLTGRPPGSPQSAPPSSSYGLMRQTKFPAPRWSLDLQVVASPCWGRPFPTLSLQSLRQALGPIPCPQSGHDLDVKSRVHHSFLESTGLTPRCVRHAKLSLPTSTGSRISGLHIRLSSGSYRLATPRLHPPQHLRAGRPVNRLHHAIAGWLPGCGIATSDLGN